MLFLQAATVELYRGAPLGDPGYWAVEDTYLDKAEAGQDHGGGFTMLGGDGRTILIRFGDLARVVGRGRRVVAATLVLTPSGGDVPKIVGATAVDAAWGEGPQSTLTRILSNAEKGGKKAGPNRGAATWNERRAGLAAWPAPGTPGGKGVAVEGGPKGRTYEIAGLGATVQGWLDRPWTNRGLALAFGGNVEFFSSQSPSGRPKLVLSTEPVPASGVVPHVTRIPEVATLAKVNGHWTANLVNRGSGGALSGTGHWWVDGKEGPAVGFSAANGVSTTVTYTGPEPKDDPQVPTLGFAIGGVPGELGGMAGPPTAEGGRVPAPFSRSRLDVFPGAKPVSLRVAGDVDPQAVVDYWNETVAPQSRFSFAPEGVRGRVRLEAAERADDGAATLRAGLRQIGAQLGLPVAAGGGDLYPGLMGYGDTRFDGTVPGKLPLPYEPYPDTPTETALLEPTGLLSGTDVGRLNDGGLPLPKVVLLRVMDLVGRPLPGLEISLERPGMGARRLKTGEGGTVALPALDFKPDLSDGTLTVRATQSGTIATSVVKAWRLSDASRRSGSPVVLADVRLDLPMLPLETGTDLADGKPLTDSSGKPYALGTPLPVEPGAWVEVDLGRDRTIGEIALKAGADFWMRYEIRVYATGTKPAEAGIWAPELDSRWARANRSEDGWLPYRAPTVRVRFVRVVSKSGGAASLAGLRVVPVRLSTPNAP